MRNLRSLKANAIIVFEASTLGALGGLPHLETLEILETSSSSFIIPTVTLPDVAFSALRKLKLFWLDLGEFKGIWQIQGLVTRPAVVQISLTAFESNSNVEVLLRDISQYSPQIVDLTITLESIGEVLSPEMIWLLRSLPLEKLSLFRIPLVSPAAACEALSVACPLLRELRISDLSVSVSDLRYFAQLSRLEILSVWVNWQSCDELNQLVPEPMFVSTVFQQLVGHGFLDSSTEAALIRKTTQYLRSFWPQFELQYTI
ncbi:hypothetical protein BDV93DRAFT_85033 [Ceratobasidium sp. AG-I]|nr:hypothetical protein BDV93DRAFT_85033 [Ceratobasidium sp. AG-I]